MSLGVAPLANSFVLFGGFSLEGSSTLDAVPPVRELVVAPGGAWLARMKMRLRAVWRVSGGQSAPPAPEPLEKHAKSAARHRI